MTDAGHLFHLAKLALELDAVGDILDVLDGLDGLPALVPDRKRVDVDTRAMISGPVLDLGDENGFAGREGLVSGTGLAGRIAPAVDLVARLPHQLLRRAAKESGLGLVDGHDREVPVHYYEPVGDAVEYGLKLVFALGDLAALLRVQ